MDQFDWLIVAIWLSAWFPVWPKWVSCGSEEKRKKFHTCKIWRGRRGEAHRYAKVDALSRGLVTYSLPERVGPAYGCCRHQYVGGRYRLPRQGSSSFLLSVWIRDSTEPAIRKNPVETARTVDEKKKRWPCPRNPGIRRLLESPFAFEFHVVILSHARWPRRCLLQRVSEICDIWGLT